MKKQLLAALAASVVISSVGTAFAAEDSSQQIKFDGSFSMHYRDQYDTHRGAGVADFARTAWKSTLTLNATIPLATNFDAYATLNYQNINTNAPGVGFVADYLHSTDKDNAGVTAIGLKYNNDGYSYVLGSQILTLGGGLVYDNGYIGRNSAPYALNINKKIGATDLTVIAAQTNYQTGLKNDKFYAVQGSYDITPETTVGAMFARVSYGSSTLSAMNLANSNVNFYSIYGSHKISDRATVSGEYLKASSTINNQAYQAAISYKLDGKNTLGAGYFHVEDQASIYDFNGAGMTTSPNTNAEGFVVSLKHKFDKTFSIKIADFHYNTIAKTSLTGGGASSDRNRFFVNATVSF